MSEAARSRPTLGIGHRPGRLFLGGLVLTVFGLIAAIHYSAAVSARQTETGDLQNQVRDLRLQVKQLAEEQALPGTILNRYRTSIGYIYASYSVGFPDRPPELATRVSGTGFLVSESLVATNRHIAQPWLGDSDAEQLIRRGAQPVLEELVIFFPDLAKPVPLRRVAVSKTSDLAILGAEGLRGRLPLSLAKRAPAVGDAIVVSGYPLGIAGMLARSPSAINQRLADSPKDIKIAKKLAELSLVRPLVSCGRIGDIVGDQLVYDAPTAHGGSGAPVFNSQSEVIAVNTAFIDGFSGGSMGVSVESLRQLIREHSSDHAGQPAKPH